MSISSVKTVSLDGIWSLRSNSGYRSVPVCKAVVPGTVAQAMEDYTGNALYGHNCLNARWTEEQLWIYERSFELDAEDIKRSIRLVFDGLDLTCRIFVNGREAGTHNNFYTPCRLNISSFVKEGENTLRVELESGIHFSAGKKVEDMYPSPWDFGNDLHRREWLRKPQSSFEWDWSPRFINAGIYKSCRLEISDGAFFDEFSFLPSVSDDLGEARAEIRAFFSVYAPKAACSLSVTVAETGEKAVSECELADGGFISASITIKSPKLWYPRGYGEQFRYTLIIEAAREGVVIASFEHKAGFRRTVIDQSDHPDGGKYFIVNINGINIFAKGGNMVPADIVYSRLDRGVYETLIDRACEANFNALRVWGGGLYESDDFYDLCDERGIIVWQDFIGACANYPGWDDAFYRNYLTEITFQIRRLSRYASLCILSGNNEIDWQSRNMFGNKLSKYPDAALYYVVIPQTLLSEGVKLHYQPSSPWSPDMSYANSDIIGDQHPWDIGFSDKDYFKYRGFCCRFPNEGGVLGPTTLPNTLSCLSEGNRFVGSFDWALHSNSIELSWPQKNILVQKLGMDEKRADSLSIPEYIYYTGLCQGEGLTEYILNFRRRMFDCASAIFWMYNDCWPAVSSWTIVDYMRLRTPAFHPVRRANSPVAVDIVKNGAAFDVYCINERPRVLSASLEYGAFTASGSYVTKTKALSLPAVASSLAVSFDIPDDGAVWIPYAMLKAENEPLARRRFIDRPANQLRMEKCGVSVSVRDGIATYTAEKFVMGVCVDLDGIEKGDNFFDLYPGKPYSIALDGGKGDILFSYQGE